MADLPKDLADAREALKLAATSISVVSHRLIRDGALDKIQFHDLVIALKHIGAADYLVTQFPWSVSYAQRVLNVPATSRPDANPGRASPTQ